MNALLIIFFLCFTAISVYKFRLGLFFFFLLLPSYLVRFSIAGIPSTVLEGMLLILIGCWLFQQKNHWRKHTKTIQHIIRQYPNLCIATLLFIVAATISVFFSINLHAALGEWKAFYIEPIVLSVLLILEFSRLDITQRYRAITHNIILPLIILGSATALLAIYQHFSGWMVPWDFWENRNTFRVTGWYGFPNGVGIFLAPLFPLGIYQLFSSLKEIKTQKKDQRPFSPSLLFYFFLSLLLVLTTPLAIIFAKSTGAIIGLGAAVGVLLLGYKSTRTISIIIAVLGVTTLFILPPSNSIKQELLAQDRSGQIRVQMWGEAVQYLSEHPIRGAGLASYQKEIYPYRIDKWIEVFHHPHNIFLTMWMNLGILGLIAFLWILLAFARIGIMAVRKKQHPTPTLPLYLLAIMAAWLTTGLVDSPYIKNDWSMFFWTIIALMLILVQPQLSAYRKEKN